MKFLTLYFKITMMLAIVLIPFLGSLSEAGYRYKLKEVVDANGYRLKIKEKITYDLGGWQQVRRVKIKVREEMPGFSIFSDGIQRRAVFHNDYNQPYYDCEINDAVSALSILNGDRDFELGGIEYEYADISMDYQISSPIQDLNKISRDVELLRNGLNPMESDQILIPIGVAARKAAAIIYGGGGYSVDASNAVATLLQRFKAAESIINSCMSIRTLDRIAEDLQAHVYHLAKTFGIPNCETQMPIQVEPLTH